MLVGGVTSLGAAAGSTGLAKYLVGALPDMQMWSVAAVIALIAAAFLARAIRRLRADQRVILGGKSPQDLVAHVADVDVIPWTSTTTGPLPAAR